MKQSATVAVEEGLLNTVSPSMWGVQRQQMHTIKKLILKSLATP